MRSLPAVFSSAQSIRRWSSASSPSRRPTNRIRTPSSCSSGVSRSILRANMAIRPSTSARERDQFSVENEYTVSSFTPSSTESRRRALTTSAPASCPASTGSPRLCAQRPFPSVMMATYRARAGSPDTDASDLQDLLLFARERGIDLAHVLVGELLQLRLGAVLVVRAHLTLALQLAQVVHHVAPHVAHRHAALLGDAVHDLHELLATLLGELGDREPDDLAVVRRREPHVGLEDRLLDRLDRVLVVGRDREQSRLAGGDLGELAQRRHGAVVVHLDPVEQVRRRAPRADRRELVSS